MKICPLGAKFGRIEKHDEANTRFLQFAIWKATTLPWIVKLITFNGLVSRRYGTKHLRDLLRQFLWNFFRWGRSKIIVHIPRNPCVRKRRLLTHGDDSSISNCRTKILAIFRGIFIIFAVFQNIYVFISLFFSEPLTVFCGTLRFRRTPFDKRCSRGWFPLPSEKYLFTSSLTFHMQIAVSVTSL